MTSLVQIVREKLLEAIRSVQPPARWKLLVVDDHSKRILFNVLKKNEILDEKVTGIIENNSALYEPQVDQEAMYLLMPTSQNVDRIIHEYSNGRQQFKRAHLFFLDGLDEQLFTRLTQSQAEPYLACLTELFVNFWAAESQAFSVESPSFFFSMYSPPRNPQAAKAARDRLMDDMRFTAKMITNTCITLNEYPFIRYYLPSHHPPLGPLAPAQSQLPPPPAEGSGRWRTNLARGAQAREFESAEREYVSKVLAWMVQDALDEYKKQNPDFPKPERNRPRGTLIITDRAMDTVAPFVHEFTYQAMANDLLPIEDGRKFTFNRLNAKGVYEDDVVILDENDTVWTEVRHMHMRETIDKLMTDFNKFLQENTSFRGEGPQNLDQMRDIIATLPQFQEQRSKFSVHLSMAQQCMDIFEKRKLPSVGNVEQCCATGLNAEGKTPKTLVEDMVPLLDDRAVINKDKVRIIALYIQHREGVPDEDRRRLYQHARLSMPEMDAINSLVHMGARISRGPNDKDLKKKIKSKPSAEDEEYVLSRFKPLLQAVLEEHVANKLDQSIFPYVKDSPATPSTSAARATPPPQTTSLRSARPNWHKAPRPGAVTSGEARQRLMVFIAGGMTYSEMRTAYQRSAALNRDVIIGATHIIKPEHFLDDLKVLELGGVGSRSAPNGLRDREGPYESFQQYYDERYYTREKEMPQPSRTTSAPAGADRLSAPRLIPSFSSSSMRSVDSGAGGGTGSKLEKKKRGLGKWF